MMADFRTYPMIVLLLPMVAAILLFMDPPDRYASSKQAPNVMQQRLYQRLADAGLEGDELATVGALTLGYKQDLNKELKHHFQASGAAHVLAVSGLHTGIIYGLVLWLLTLGGRLRPLHENRFGRWTISLIIMAVMWAYAWLTGMTPSVVRAVIMVCMIEISRMAYRNPISLNAIASAAVFILIFRPTDLWSVSFQLSFAATTAIVLCAKGFEGWFSRKYLSGWTGRIVAWITGTVIVSLAAQLGTLPITIYYFHQVSAYFLLTNLIVLPLATLLVPFGLATIALGGTWAGQWIGKATEALAWLMNHSVGWIESLPGSTFPAHTNGYLIALYYILLIGFYFVALRKQTDTQ